MPVERRGQVTDVGSEPTGNRRSSNSRREAAAFVRWHEPDDARVSSPDVCPGKASMFSRRQSCRGKSQSPVVRIAKGMETEPSKPIDENSRGEIHESPGCIKRERIVASQMSESRGPSLHPEGEGS